MNKIKVTQQQRDNALDALHNMWPSVPGANVAERLNKWREPDALDGGALPNCNTICCFGGWCAWWPAFRRQGVVPNAAGEPRTRATTDFYVAEELFGDVELFRWRGKHFADNGFTGTDHALVTNRLRWLIENSEVAA